MARRISVAMASPHAIFIKDASFLQAMHITPLLRHLRPLYLADDYAP